MPNPKVILVANIIAKVETDLDFDMLRACLKSVHAICDRTVLYYAPGVEVNEAPHRIAELCQLYRVNLYVHSGPVSSFAELRNRALALVNEGEFFVWIDSDEVAFPDDFAALKRQMARLHTVDNPLSAVATRFVHFCLSPDTYEYYQPRVTIIRKGPDTRWEGSVHEKLVGYAPGRVLHSDYIVCHYGYVKPQAQVFARWQHYAEIEGDPTRYKNEEVDGKCVPYFRPGERPSPEHILDDRRKTLLPYHGYHPDPSLYTLLKTVAHPRPIP